MKQTLSLILYHVGDYISEITYRHDIRYMWLFHMYQRIMILSSKYDEQNKIWQIIDNIQVPKVQR